MIGPLLVFGFVLLSAVRDVYFGHIFQSVGFFTVVLIGCTICTVFFLVVSVLRRRSGLEVLRHKLDVVIVVNVTTAIAWIFYFFALTHTSPAVANTLYSGIGPITIIALDAAGWRIVARGPVRRLEAIFFAGVGASLLLIAFGAINGMSGVQSESMHLSFAGVALAAIAGSSLVISILYTRKLHDHGAGSDAILATRFILIIVIAALAEASNERSFLGYPPTELAWLGLSASVLIVMPIYVLQLGVARSVPLTANIIRALGPVAVFGTQLVDPRVVFSSYMLCALLLYAFCIVGANVVRVRLTLETAKT